jgi:hypothetical protein
MRHLLKNSRSFSINTAFFNFNGQTCIQEMKNHYKNLDHKYLIFALYKLEANFEEYKQKCSSSEASLYTNKIRTLIVELDYISLALARYQDCGKGIELLYENMHKTLMNSSVNSSVNSSKHD